MLSLISGEDVWTLLHGELAFQPWSRRFKPVIVDIKTSFFFLRNITAFVRSVGKFVLCKL